MKIALVTFEFAGLTTSGGIGTAYCRLAHLLASQGHSVTAVVVPFGWDETFELEKKKRAREVAALKRKRIEVVFLGGQGRNPKLLHEFYHLQRSVLVYEFLREKAFRVIHSPDNCGLTWFSLLSKRSGLKFQNAEFVVGSHGSSFWSDEANRVLRGESVLIDQIDRYCVENADYLVSPSAYMIKYVRKKGWRLPISSCVIPNVNALTKKQLKALPSKSAPSKPKDLVFFGRIEIRKGILLFVSALERLMDSDHSLGSQHPIRVFFVGREEPEKNGLTDLISEKLGRFGSRLHLEFIQNFSHQESLKFLAGDLSRLVCMPSLLENSPYVLMESIELGLDFISTNSGGQAELLHASDQDKVLVPPTVSDLYLAMRKRLQSAPISARPSRLAVDANVQWISFHQKVSRKKKIEKKKHPLPVPCVSVVIDAKTSEGLSAALASLATQDLPPLEVLVPYGLILPHNQKNRIKPRYFKTAPSSSKWIDAARAAKGRYVLFLKDGELVQRTTLRDWVSAAEAWSKSDKDCLAVSGIVSRYGQWLLPCPSDPLLCISGKPPGNSFALWNRSLFLKQCSSWTLDMSSERAIAPFFSKALASQLRFGIFPEEVVRTNGHDSELTDWDQLSKVEPFLNVPPSDWGRWICYLAGQQRDFTRLEMTSRAWNGWIARAVAREKTKKKAARKR